MSNQTMEFERRFWANWYLNRHGLDQAMKFKQYEHQMHYLPYVNKWGIGFRAPEESVIEIGPGPCGLVPWLGRGLTEGIEPLADYHQSQGIDYQKLGYTCVFSGKVQEFIVEYPPDCRYDMVVSCNVIDHDPDPQGLLSIMTRLGRRVFCVYDVRHKATELHPGITVDLKIPEGWKVAKEDTMPPLCDPNEITGRRAVLLEKA